jgi:peroxiredoxin Q/BCP
VIGVSADSQEEAERFKQSLDLPFPLVGDPKGKILDAFGVRIPIVGLARRATFVVGRDHKVAKAYESNLDAESHVVQACTFVAGRKKKA